MGQLGVPYSTANYFLMISKTILGQDAEFFGDNTGSLSQKFHQIKHNNHFFEAIFGTYLNWIASKVFLLNFRQYSFRPWTYGSLVSCISHCYWVLELSFFQNTHKFVIKIGKVHVRINFFTKIIDQSGYLCPYN